MDLSGLSITELKQLLARVNHDLKLNKPTIKRKAKVLSPIISELAECNIIAARFTKTVTIENIEHKRIKQDIQIQKDILDYLNNGGRIITTKRRKSFKPFTVSYSNKVTL
jgi:hypothetical protein